MSSPALKLSLDRAFPVLQVSPPPIFVTSPGETLTCKALYSVKMIGAYGGVEGGHDGGGGVRTAEDMHHNEYCALEPKQHRRSRHGDRSAYPSPPHTRDGEKLPKRAH